MIIYEIVNYKNIDKFFSLLDLLVKLSVKNIYEKRKFIYNIRQAWKDS